MFERRVQVQGRDGREHEFVLPDTALPPASASSTMAMLRLTLPALASGESASPAASFFRQSRDASNLVMMLLDPDSWLELERTSRACRAAVLASKCWAGPVAGGHSLRFPPQGRKGAYVRHRRAVWRVARGFQDLRRFARSPASVFNPGASLADTFRAERETGVVFPDEARASFTYFDGQARSSWLRSEGVIGGFELLSLEQSVELMLDEACFRGASGQLPEFVPLADRRNCSQWLAAAVEGGRVCVIKPLSRPKVVAGSWSNYLRVQ